MTAQEVAILGFSTVVVLRGVFDGDFSSGMVALILGLLGLIPVTRADERRRKNRE